MKNSEEVEEIRNKIITIRGEIQDLQMDSPTWKGNLDPSVGGLTCILESLWNTMDDMKKHENKWEN